MPLTFGKHQGKTLPQVMFSDPDWFFWAVEQNAFNRKHPIAEVELVNVRSRRIRVPATRAGGPREVEYLIHPNGGLDHIELVPASRRHVQGVRRAVIDLSFPRAVSRGMDKTGARNLLNDLRGYLFGGVSRLTRARCEAFFDDVANFTP